MLRKIITKISTKILGCLLFSKLRKVAASKSRRLGILISFIGTLLLILYIVELVNGTIFIGFDFIESLTKNYVA